MISAFLAVTFVNEYVRITGRLSRHGYCKLEAERHSQLILRIKHEKISVAKLTGAIR